MAHIRFRDRSGATRLHTGVRRRIGSSRSEQLVLVAVVSAHLRPPKRVGGASLDPVAIPILVVVGATSAYMVVAAPLPFSLVRSQKRNPPSEVTPVCDQQDRRRRWGGKSSEIWPS